LLEASTCPLGNAHRDYHVQVIRIDVEVLLQPVTCAQREFGAEAAFGATTSSCGDLGDLSP
jgi:hypothetical protein